MKIPKQLKVSPTLDKIIQLTKTLIIIVLCSILVAVISIFITRIYEPTISTSDALSIRQQRALDLVDEAQQEISQMQRLEAESAVEAEFLQEDITELREELIQICKEANWMADYIGNNHPATLDDGTVLNVSELKQYAEQQLQRSKILMSRIRTMNDMLTLYLENAETARQRWKTIYQKVALLELQIESIDIHAKHLQVYEQQPVPILKGNQVDDNLVEAQELIDGLEKTLKKKVAVHEIMASIDRDSGYVDIEGTLSTSTLIAELRSLSNSIHEW